MRSSIRRHASCRYRPRRNGTVIAGVLLCLVAAAALLVALLNILRFEHKHLQRTRLNAQTRWLAESALERAAARLHADPNFTGERWEIAAEQLGGSRPATVTIDANMDGPLKGTLKATAVLGSDEVRKSSFTKQLLVSRDAAQEN